jgi:hypothetical protein
MPKIPAHIRVTDQQVRDLHATCARCDAKVHIGVYPEPGRADHVLAEWIRRHRHEAETEPS